MALTISSCNTDHGSENVYLTKTQNENVVPKYGFFEISFEHNGNYRNKFFDVSLEVEFVSPSGAVHRVSGFYYDTDLWKVRFRPDEPGVWKYNFAFNTNKGVSKKGDGSFECRNSDAAGPVLRHPENPYRWIFANGKPYFPLGLQDGVGATGRRQHEMFIDGDITRNNPQRVSQEEYLSVYGQAGFNLLRFSQQNCSLQLYDDLDHYRVDACIVVDEFLSVARKNGFRIMFGFFGFHTVGKHENMFINVFKHIKRKMLRTFLNTPGDLGNLEKEKRFVDYCIARWGVYADFWELLNERNFSDEWTTLMAKHVRAVDPDRKPISTSWERPHLEAIDINAPHWYESESEFQSDLRVQQQAKKWKQTGKPVIVGEQGNTGMNWDPLSALRMRIRTWTALFYEISLVFWNTSWSKSGMHKGIRKPGRTANIYLGPEERGYIRILQDFSSRLPADVRMIPVKVSLPHKVRAYGMRSQTTAAVYLHHFENHTEFIHDLNISLDLPSPTGSKTKLICEWIDPSNGRVLKCLELAPGQEALEVPSFTIDFALLISPASV